ncbi:Coiled-coil domain-containing protein 97 [Chionoecetes opilio]|uniref:Coiled-coil domain-containing protein 97 n=1 Tax=Chionoecetes opilio TaxID=41210 RepID=A0A8J4XP39_CHIOP|nr:Coiled-coil domain-containing protein 97 [Chionoecetes opilio]
MWGEFEDEEQDQRKECHEAQPSSERPCAASEVTGNTTTREDDIYALPLRDRVLHIVAASNIEVKSQQKYDPDLTYEERKEIIEKLLKEKPGQFLYRFGKHLEQEHLQHFLEYEGDVEVDHFLAEALKNKNKHTAKITARNRRYAALQKMRRGGDYFSEQEMERRDPLLYDHLIGQHQTREEREEKYNATTTDTNKVDENPAFDLLDIQAKDEEERYFDKDEEEEKS